MKHPQKGFVIPPIAILIAAVLTIVGVTYYSLRSPEKTEIAQKETQTKSELSTARAKLAAERAKLNTMEEDFAESYSIFSILRGQYTRTRTAVDRTAVFFGDITAVNEKFKTDEPGLKKSLDAKYFHVLDLLDNWKAKTEYAYVQTVTTATLADIKKDAAVIQQFIQELAAVVNSLTPENSLFSELQIKQYQDLLAEVLAEVEQGVTIMEDASAHPPAPTPANPSSTPTITPEQLQQQQAVVNAAAAEVAKLEEELKKIQEAQNPPPPPETSPSPTPIPPPSYYYYVPTTDTTNSEEEQYLLEKQTIIINPVTPPLLQGSNKKK